MRGTSILGRMTDTLLSFLLKQVCYFVWFLIAILVMLNLNFNPDYANYWSLAFAILYYFSKKHHFPMRLTRMVKGKWKYPNAIEYHQKQWKFIVINILPIIAMPIASAIIFLFPRPSINTNGLTFIAMLITIITANLEFDNSMNSKYN